MAGVTTGATGEIPVAPKDLRRSHRSSSIHRHHRWCSPWVQINTSSLSRSIRLSKRIWTRAIGTLCRLNRLTIRTTSTSNLRRSSRTTSHPTTSSNRIPGSHRSSLHQDRTTSLLSNLNDLCRIRRLQRHLTNSSRSIRLSQIALTPAVVTTGTGPSENSILRPQPPPP